MKLRTLALVCACLAFAGTRVSGAHVHVVEDHGHDHHHASAPHHHAHVTTALADDHLAGHTEDNERDVAGPALAAKVPSTGLPVLLAALWLGFLLVLRIPLGIRLPHQWLRPPDIGLRPTVRLPPSQGPPRPAAR